MSGLFDSSIALTGKVLDLRLQRQNLVASNLANVNTPGYKGKTLEFEDSLQKAIGKDARGKMTKTSKMHVPANFDPTTFSGRTIADFEPRVVHGENAVDIDNEMVTMTKNSLAYNALTQVITKSFKGMEKVIQAGAR
ncbi:flagellar basal body rod protein FlgB [Maridesulfovibrio frigidus]|uniref:flagellar basal body rod protein FlgB n=1 Tax=Maridesulfovibrio frigidus TaxID=340956 RepID=UPI0004E0C643|nr:flagellar basal body rod protein FlgB [Maridesulfovibrio frigidus]